MPPTTPAPRARFIALLAENITRGTFEKLTLGKPRQPAADPALQNVFVRPIALKSGPHLTFVWRHATRDVTKNFPTAEAVAQIAANPAKAWRINSVRFKNFQNSSRIF